MDQFEDQINVDRGLKLSLRAGSPHCLQGGIPGKLGIAKPIVEPRAKGGAATAAPVGQESIQNWRPSLWYVCCSSFIFMFMFK